MKQSRPFVQTPREAAELRRKLLIWYSSMSDMQRKWFEHRWPLPPDPQGEPNFHANSVARERDKLQYGELFLVSDEMTELARCAAMSLPRFALEKEDFPADRGLIIFHHAVCEIRQSAETSEMVAATWRWGPSITGEYGAWLAWYEDRDCGDLLPAYADREAEIRALNRDLLPRLTPTYWGFLPLGVDFEAERRKAPLLPVVLAAFLLMTQPLAAKDRQSLNPLDRRRARRSGVRADSDVTVIRLRHLQTAGSGATVRPVDWRHRWIVRGHWRNQWLPSRGVHRPTWINPHIKGPDDAPFLISERVNVWSR